MGSAIESSNSTRDLEIAWAAGLFEGEGCAYIRRVQNRLYPRAALETTDEDVLRKFHAIVGVGTIIFRPRRDPAWKDQWRWHVQNNQGAVGVIRLLLPYLGERRTKQCERVLAVAK